MVAISYDVGIVVVTITTTTTTTTTTSGLSKVKKCYNHLSLSISPIKVKNHMYVINFESNNAIGIACKFF